MNPKLVPPCGPPGPIAIVGEAPGLNESIYGRLFVGEAGQELSRILKDAGLPPLKDLYVSNVFKHQPDNNDVLEFFCPRTSPEACLDLPPLRPGKFLRRQHQPALSGLIPELVSVGAKVVIALGGTALWALLGYQKISAYAGTVHKPSSRRTFYVIPTYHPSAVLRQWSLRTTVLANLTKVHECLALASEPLSVARSGPKPSSTPKIQTNPSLAQIKAFVPKALAAPLIALDVETAHGQIRTISFSLGPNEAFVIPFWEPPKSSYWPTLDGERQAWDYVAQICASPVPKVGHNILYDIQYLWRVHGIPVLGEIHDTMFLHHAMEPELPRSLGGLASVYLSMPEWKSMRLKSEKEEA